MSRYPLAIFVTESSNLVALLVTISKNNHTKNEGTSNGSSRPQYGTFSSARRNAADTPGSTSSSEQSRDNSTPEEREAVMR